MVTSIILVLGYATCHTLILFVHVETLNVAMNSADQALLTLLISGNFAEIKSTVFKKYNRPALFKIAASDICERFKLGLFLGLVLLLNICQVRGFCVVAKKYKCIQLTCSREWNEVSSLRIYEHVQLFGALSWWQTLSSTLSLQSSISCHPKCTASMRSSWLGMSQVSVMKE